MECQKLRSDFAFHQSKPGISFIDAEEVGNADTAKVWPAVAKREGETPADEAAGMRLVDELQDFKTECYKTLVQTAQPRPGVLELMDSAIRCEGLAVGICSASTRGGFEKV